MLHNIQNLTDNHVMNIEWEEKPLIRLDISILSSRFIINVLFNLTQKYLSLEMSRIGAVELIKFMLVGRVSLFYFSGLHRHRLIAMRTKKSY